MDSRHKNRIQINFTKLIEQISPEIEVVCSYLLNEHKIINKRMWEDIIEENRGASKRTRKLLETLFSRGPNAFQKLYESVLSAELYDAADTLMPENIPHWKCVNDAHPAHMIKNPNAAFIEQHHSSEKKEDIDVIDQFQQGYKNDLQTASCRPSANSLPETITHLKQPVLAVDEDLAQELESPLDNSLTELNVMTKPPEDLSTEVKEIVTSSLNSQTGAMTVNRQTDNKELVLKTSQKTSPMQDWIHEKNRIVKQVEMTSHMGQLFKEILFNPKHDEIYVMKNKIRGNAVLIDNQSFICHQKFVKRIGSEKDNTCLQNLFKALSFNVKIYNNLKKDAMLQILKQESQLIEKEHECFILAISSHGTRGYIYGTDGKKPQDNEIPENAVSVEEIKEIFCHVKNLIGKPKLFFIQACRGEKKDLGLEESDSGKSPSHGDCAIAMASTDGIASWRDKDNGTWFIQAVVKIFSEYAHSFEINELMRRVINLVSQRETKESAWKQAPEFITTLSKKLYFFPGLDEEFIRTMPS